MWKTLSMQGLPWPCPAIVKKKSSKFIKKTDISSSYFASFKLRYALYKFRVSQLVALKVPKRWWLHCQTDWQISWIPWNVYKDSTGLGGLSKPIKLVTRAINMICQGVIQEKFNRQVPLYMHLIYSVDCTRRTNVLFRHNWFKKGLVTCSVPSHYLKWSWS